MRGQRKCVKVLNTSHFHFPKVLNTSGDIPEPPVRPGGPPEASPCQRASGQPSAWCKMMAKDAFGSPKIDKNRCCGDYVGDRLNFQRRFWEGKNYFWA